MTSQLRVDSTGKQLTGSETDDLPPQTRAQRKTQHVQLATLCWTLFLAGWNDGTVGPLLPRIQQSYHVGYTIVSLVFVFQCLGCFLGALANIPLTPKYGFGKLMLVGSTCQMIAYSLQASGAPVSCVRSCWFRQWIWTGHAGRTSQRLRRQHDL
ncbi:MFS general substrate transporter [Mycena indigotica]|uniref:MFS general substrate transporter n=1 Tax=Mycena indigotica TaxID=2126181 RepID=A0A8H6SG01_9AGAR|nr:MFS general substrate transporter [Mycena indigotica]KAF7297160.1 MFS general substrate transporter [Mycena indigotica]